MKCPHCGKKTNVTPIESLKIHIKSRIEYLKKTLAHWINLGEKLSRGEQRIANKKTTLAKWQSWLDTIEKLELEEKVKCLS